MTEENKSVPAPQPNTPQRVITNIMSMIGQTSIEYHNSINGVGKKIRENALQNVHGKLNWVMGALNSLSEIVADREDKETDEKILDYSGRIREMTQFLSAILDQEHNGQLEIKKMPESGRINVHVRGTEAGTFILSTKAPERPENDGVDARPESMEPSGNGEAGLHGGEES